MASFLIFTSTYILCPLKIVDIYTFVASIILSLSLSEEHIEEAVLMWKNDGISFESLRLPDFNVDISPGLSQDKTILRKGINCK